MSNGSSLAMMPWFARDYLAATRAMRLAERGAYCDLLFYQWEMGDLPCDAKSLARLLGAERSEFDAVWRVVKNKFVKRGSRLINIRLEEHRLKAIERREKKSAGAKKTNEKRYGERPLNGSHSGSLSDTLSASPPSPSPSPIPTPTPPKGGAVRQRRSPKRAELDEARVKWRALLQSGGKDRDDRVQAAIDAVGGWTRIAQRTDHDESRLVREFCEAYVERSHA
jgi:uncharacterized protein YdaU (DUF1376 family)